MKSEFSRQIFEKCSNIIFHERPSSGSQVITSGRTDGHRNMKKLIFVSLSFVTAPKKQCTKQHFIQDKAEVLMHFLF